MRPTRVTARATLPLGLVSSLFAACSQGPISDRALTQAIHTCDPASASVFETFALFRKYTTPQGISRNELNLSPGWAYLFTPDIVPVTAGQSGSNLFELTWHTASGVSGVCAYRGTGSVPQSTTCTNNGKEYRLLFCTTSAQYTANNCRAYPLACALNPSVLAATSIPHGGLIEQVDHAIVENFEGDKCATTRATMVLKAPVDDNADGDFIPTCAEADTSAPAWPAGSVLAATRTSTDAVTLVWTAATDNIGVAGYSVYHEAQLVREVSAGTLTTTITGLGANVPHEFRVQAIDAAGNASTNGPATSLTLDASAPTWPLASALSASAAGPASTTLVWTPASDNLAVTGYRVYLEGLPIAEVPASRLVATVADLATDVTLHFQVQAVDADGNQSSDGPSATLLLDGSTPVWAPAARSPPRPPVRASPRSSGLPRRTT